MIHILAMLGPPGMAAQLRYIFLCVCAFNVANALARAPRNGENRCGTQSNMDFSTQCTFMCAFASSVFICRWFRMKHVLTVFFLLYILVWSESHMCVQDTRTSSPYECAQQKPVVRSCVYLHADRAERASIHIYLGGSTFSCVCVCQSMPATQSERLIHCLLWRAM